MFTIFKKREKMRGFKLTTPDRSRKIGIAASSLKILKEKAKDKLKITKCRVFLSTDGTEVDDESYFSTIPDQSLLVVAGPDEEVKTDFQLMLDCFRQNNMKLISAAEGTREYVEQNREQIKKWLENLTNVTDNETDGSCTTSLKIDHPSWFQGTDSKYNSKEEAMSRRAQDRIRGYFYKAKDELTKSEIYRRSEAGRQHLNELLTWFRVFLHGCDYFGCLFDRSRVCNKDDLDSGLEPLNKRAKTVIAEAFEQQNEFAEQCRTLCDDTGQFQCQGRWDDVKCQCQHSINPYKSRENLIVFQTWNLDHQIEFGRSIIPSVISTLNELLTGRICPQHKHPASALNVMRIFLELFTISNLKLVHIACHVKEAHSLGSKLDLLCEECPDYKKIQGLKNKFNDFL